MTSIAKRLSAITLFVEDLAAAKEFYTRVLGLSVHFEDPESVVFDLAGTLVNLLAASAAPELIDPATVGGPDSGHRCVYTLPVDDVDAACRDLTERGARLLNGPMDRPWGVRTASFVDPAGNIWEFAH